MITKYRALMDVLETNRENSEPPARLGYRAMIAMLSEAPTTREFFEALPREWLEHLREDVLSRLVSVREMIEFEDDCDMRKELRAESNALRSVVAMM